MIPTAPVRFFEFFDVITLSTLLIVITSLVLAHKKRNGSILNTISQTVAASPKSSLIFSLSMTVCYPLYYAFIWLWVGPITHMPTGFYYLLIISALFEMIFVWVPATSGNKAVIHTVAASVVFVALFIMTLCLLLLGKGMSIVGVIGLWSSILTSVALSVVLLLQRLKQQTFVFEVLYCVICLVSVSIVAHT